MCKKTEGQRRNNAPQFWYSLRPLGLPIYEKILGDVSTSHGRAVADVFGTWEDWGSDWEKTMAQCPPEEDAHEREMWEPGFFIVDEVVDIQSLVRYSNLRVDRSQQDHTDYITLHQTKGWLEEKGLSHIEQRYWGKLIAGRPLDRMYGDAISLQNITKEARAAACSSFPSTWISKTRTRRSLALSFREWRWRTSGTSSHGIGFGGKIRLLIIYATLLRRKRAI